MEDAGRASTPRYLLAGRPGFGRVSPEVGRLDTTAFEAEMTADPDAALGLLVDMANATDPGLRALARRLAGRVLLRMARSGPLRSPGVGRLRPRRADGAAGDLDLDASLEPIAAATAGGRPPALDELVVRSWSRPRSARCLVVDRSGSMRGERLAAMALAAAAVAWRQGDDDYSVIAFSSDVVVVKAQGVHRPVEAVVDDLLNLRGHGLTDLALALGAAREQLARSSAPERHTLVLSDGRATAGADPWMAARATAPVLVLAPAGDTDAAARLAAAGGGACAEVRGPADVPAALATLLG